VPDLTTTVRIEGVGADDLRELSRTIEESLVRAIRQNQEANVTAYFVEPDFAQECLRIGLRFDVMDAMNIEDTATRLLDIALGHASEATTHAPSTRRTSTQLVGV
jgi:hypothetical protein